MYNLITIAIIPVILFCAYIFIRDKYEKEPLIYLTLGYVFGVVFSVVIIKTASVMYSFKPADIILGNFYNAFVTSAFVEEVFKFLVLYFLFWNNGTFNEWYDGIVYAVFISLGFATVENILYVFNPTFGGVETGFYRGLFSIPGHGLFGVTMGYYLGLGKFIGLIDEKKQKKNYILKSLFIPFILHGFYNLILSLSFKYYFVIFIVYNLLLWKSCLKKIKAHVRNSPFKTRKAQENNI